MTISFPLSAFCRALEGKSTIGRVFRKHFWLGPPPCPGGPDNDFCPKDGGKMVYFSIQMD